MRRFLDLSIRHKVTALTMLISGVALLLGCGIFAVSEQANFRRTMARDYTVLAGMVAENLASGLTFNDADSMNKTLATLDANSHIVAACVYDKAGSLVASYQRAGRDGGFQFSRATGASQQFGANRLDTYHEIKLAGEVVGTLYIGADLEELRARASRYALIVAALLVGCSLVAWLLAARLQKVISEPIVELARIAGAVAAEKNYSVRATKRGDDEVGRLIGGFNDMLGEIQARDAALRAAHDELERRVEERTRDLSREQARFRLIFDSVPVGLTWMTLGDLSSRIVNAAHASITGVPVERSREIGLYRLATHPDDRAGQDELHRRLLAGEIERYAIEKRYCHPDGSVRWAALTVLLLRNASNEVHEINTVMDITERKRAEAKLAEASGLLEAMLENSPDMIYFKDRASRFVRFSKAMHARLGVRDSELLIGKCDADFFSAEHAQPAYDDEQKIIRTGEPIIGKLEMETYPDKPTTWALTTKMPWRDGTGAIVGTFGISKDVTALKEAEDRLAYERDQLRALLDASPDTIYFKDLESRFVLVSRSKVRKTLERVPDLRARRGAHGLPADVPEAELLTGLTDFDALQESDARAAFEAEQQIVRTGEAILGHVEKQVYLSGAVRWNISNKMPWRNRDGEIVGTFGISKDITELKEAEEKLEQMHRQLLQTSRQAGMAEVATGVLHNVGNVLNSVNVSATLVADQVRHTKAANVAKLAALFAQNMGHLAEFVTKDPRGQMIPGYLGTLADMLADEHKAVLLELENLRKNVEHIKDIVAMQQAYARTSGVIETVSVPEMVEDAIRINAGSLARHDVDVLREYEARPVVTTDKHKVIQILINLIRNAKYACDEAGRSHKQIVVRSTRDEQWVRIAVIDNGVGILPENLVRIFNHGFTTREHGHGFGLHSGALAAKELGGALTVHSDGPGHGATFTLELPLAAAAEARA